MMQKKLVNWAGSPLSIEETQGNAVIFLSTNLQVHKLVINRPGVAEGCSTNTFVIISSSQSVTLSLPIFKTSLLQSSKS